MPYFVLDIKDYQDNTFIRFCQAEDKIEARETYKNNFLNAKSVVARPPMGNIPLKQYKVLISIYPCKICPLLAYAKDIKCEHYGIDKKIHRTIPVYAKNEEDAIGIVRCSECIYKRFNVIGVFCSERRKHLKK